MKSVFAFGASLSAAVGLVGLVAVLPACSSTTTKPAEDLPEPPVTECDPAKCAPGNECLLADGDLKCRKPCASNTATELSCPAGFVCAAANFPSTIPPECAKGSPSATRAACTQFAAAGTRLTAFTCVDVVPKGCVAADDQGTYCCNEAPAETFAKPVCMKQFGTVTPGPKQWGTPCNPTKGFDDNEDCDVAQGFSCYGTGPADATAYCTRYSCNSDRECAGGYSCATINVGPNVTTLKRTFHETTTACLRRDYCAPCQADLDCPLLNGRIQHCIGDDNYVGFCTPECVTSANCNLEAKCIDAGAMSAPAAVGGVPVKTCYPRAGKCVGDATLCSPCRADSDCGDDGACIKGQYTTERACAKKSGVACSGTTRQCPPSSKAGVRVGCTTKNDDVPDNYCFGVYDFNESVDLGCWTPAR